MRPGVRAALGGGLATAVAAAVAGLSQVSYTADPGPEALLRLSWRARGERVEVCRDVTEEELRKLPQHMRQPRVCEGTTAPYRVVVSVDGEPVADEIPSGSGTRQARPLYVYRELPLSPGAHHLSVLLERVGGAAESPPQESEIEEDHKKGVVPPRLHLEETVHLAPRQVLLVTYDAERQALITR